jgi:hypothetical protein
MLCGFGLQRWDLSAALLNSSNCLFTSVQLLRASCFLCGKQVEIKLRLPDQASYEKVADLLKGTLKAVHDQENYFFDGPNKELSSQRVVLRCRFYNKDAKAEIACKVLQV